MHWALKKHVWKGWAADKTDKWESTDGISVSKPEFQERWGSVSQGTMQHTQEGRGAVLVSLWSARSAGCGEQLSGLRAHEVGGEHLSGVTARRPLACSWK